MLARSFWMLRSRTRNFSFIGQLPIILDCLGDRADPRAQVHIPFEDVLESTPEGSLRSEVIAVDRHVHVGVRTKTTGLQDRAEEVDGMDGGEPRSRPADGLPGPFEHRLP